MRSLLGHVLLHAAKCICVQWESCYIRLYTDAVRCKSPVTEITQQQFCIYHFLHLQRRPLLLLYLSSCFSCPPFIIFFSLFFFLRPLILYYPYIPRLCSILFTLLLCSFSHLTLPPSYSLSLFICDLILNIVC